MRKIKGTLPLVYNSSSVQCIGHGNSLTLGTGSTTGNRWTDQIQNLAPLSGTGIAPANNGVGGQRIFFANNGFVDMINTGPTAVDALLSSTKTTILFAWEGTNELGANGNDPVAAYAAWRTYCLNRKSRAAALGKALKIISVTCNPYAGLSNTDAAYNIKNQAVRAFNDLLRAGYHEHSDYLCDIANYADFGAINAAAAANGGVYTQAMLKTSPVFVRSDGTADDWVHYGNYGYGIVAAGFAETLKLVRV